VSDIESALDGVTADRLLDHIRTLSSPAFQGRRPGTEGETITVAYLEEQLRALGLRGGMPDGGFVQEVPVVSNTPHPATRISFPTGEPLTPAHFDDYLIRSPHPRVDLRAPLVFVGFGADAPEYDWNDYPAEVDLAGAIVVTLAGDPSRPDPADPSRQDPTFFRGSGMTYHGRWNNKFDVADRHGAAGCLIVHDDVRAGYPFSVPRSGWEGEHLGMEAAPDRMPVEGWLTRDFARTLLARAGHDLDDLERRALQPGFRPVVIGAEAHVTLENETRRFTSHNVVARLDGTDPALADECVVYSAHWDHFGQKVEEGETATLGGAVDNASGCSAVLEIARALAASPGRRSFVFLFFTLEESGLLGAAHYVTEPALPIDDTVAILNLDMMNVWGRTSDVVSTGRGHSSLDAVLERRAADLGRTVTDDPEPDKGYFYRSDHLEFLRKGVPALFFLHPGSVYVDRPADYGTAVRARYVSELYHKPGDAIEDDWDLAGMVDDVRMLARIGRDVADADDRPVWSPDSEFAPGNLATE
jgi:Predicted aminopeptidases